MKTSYKAVAEHYNSPGLYQRIIQNLKENGLDINAIQRSDISGVDEFHVRGAQVSKELAAGLNLENLEVLDVGCGIGGPCRMLAEEFGCKVTGLDLSAEFIATAKQLSALIGLENRTDFVEGNATALPFDDHSFDLVWTQHVQMNVEDKQAFYSEIARVLKSGGTFIYYDIFKKGDEDVAYPMPWANEAAISFLSPRGDIKDILEGLGFRKDSINDQTSEGIFFFDELLKKTAQQQAPKLGLSLLMGASTKTKIGNLLTALKEGKLLLESGKYTIK